MAPIILSFETVTRTDKSISSPTVTIKNGPNGWFIKAGSPVADCIGEKTFLNENKVNEKNQSGTMICSDETEDSLVSLFKMISENDMRTFMDEQGNSVLNHIFQIF